jgi:hypothetical protein
MGKQDRDSGKTLRWPSDRAAEALGLFHHLTKAIDYGRFQEGIRAQKRLAELGFVVRFRPDRTRSNGTVHPAEAQERRNAAGRSSCAQVEVPKCCDSVPTPWPCEERNV